jgi:uncharacterized protein (TIGR02996 family)
VLINLLQGIVEEPQAEDRWAVLADYLEEHDDPRRAELLWLHRRLLATCCQLHQHPDRASCQARIVALLAGGVKPCMPQQTILLDKRIPMTFSWIPPGSLLMGSPSQEEGREDDEPLHLVTFSKEFWLGVFPVTQAQWQWAMKGNPSHFKGDTRPVDTVSWNDCQEFCKELGERTGKRYRLPSEAEWEYACRAGTTSPFFCGQAISTDQANYNGNYTYGDGRKGVYRQETTTVGSFPANAWGLHDMHGSVEEWCQDCYGPYRQGDTKDPPPRSNGSDRVLRGGSWHVSPRNCRSALRHCGSPGDRNSDCGCRVVLCLD